MRAFSGNISPLSPALSLMVFLFLVVALSSASPAGSANAAALAPSTDQPPLELQVVALDNTTINADNAFHVSIALHNVSTEPVIISNELDELGGDATTKLTFTDESGHTTGFDFVMFPQKNPRKLGPPAPHELIARWMLLYGGLCLGREFTLKPADYPALSRPGKHKLVATYAASGYDYQTWKDDPFGPDKPTQSLGLKSWSGKIESAPLTLTVLKHRIGE